MENLVGGVFLLIGVLASIAGVGLLCFDLYEYLRVGAWESLSVADLIISLSVETATLMRFDWVGLWDILDSIPLWAGLIGAGALLGLLASEAIS